MAFIHLDIPGNSGQGPVCTMDGWKNIYLNGGEYAEIPSGYHVFSFESGNTRWNIQETLDDDDCLDVLVVFNFGQIAGEPKYSIEKIDDITISMVQKCIEEQEKKEKLKSKRKWGAFLLMLDFYITVIGIVLIAVICIEQNSIDWGIIIGVLITSILGVILFVRRLKKVIQLFRKH